MLWVLALLAIVIGGGYATLPLWEGYVTGLAGPPQSGPAAGEKAVGAVEPERDAINARLGVLIGRLDALERRLDDVRKMVEATTLPNEVADASKSLRRLSGRLTKIEQNSEVSATVLDRLNRLERDVAAAPPAKVTAAIGGITKRLKNLETVNDEGRRRGAAQTNAQAVLLAVGQLRQAIASGAPYTLALQALLRIGGNDSRLSEAAGGLQTHAATGVPSLKTLTREYNALAAEITAPDTAGGFFEQTLNRLKALVKISRIKGQGEGPATTDTPADRAGQALHDGDLQTAVGILQGLKEPSGRVREWVRRARNRLAVERSLALLNVYAVSLLPPAAE